MSYENLLTFDNKEKTAIIVIDMQVDFVKPDGIIPAENGMDIVDNIDKLLTLARKNGLPVIYTQEMHRPDGADFGIEGAFEPIHCVEGTPGMEIIEELTPKEGDYVIRCKRAYDAFIGTDLDILLRNLDIENLIFVGVCTDICVISSIYHARCLNYKNCVLTDCTAASKAKRHDISFRLMEHVWANVYNLDEAIDLFHLA